MKEQIKWSREYLPTQTIYDNNIFISLTRVREMIQNEQKAQVSYERKFDVVVKVEEIQPPSNWEEVEKVLLKVTDQSNILFTLTISSKVMANRRPEDQIAVGQVVRIVKLHKTQD